MTEVVLSVYYFVTAYVHVNNESINFQDLILNTFIYVPCISSNPFCSNHVFFQRSNIDYPRLSGFSIDSPSIFHSFGIGVQFVPVISLRFPLDFP